MWPVDSPRLRAGKPECFGPSAWLEKDGLSVVVTSISGQPIDLAFCRTIGVDCTAMRCSQLRHTAVLPLRCTL